MTINKDICAAKYEKTPKKYVDEEEVENIFPTWYMMHMPFAKALGEVEKDEKEST